MTIGGITINPFDAAVICLLLVGGPLGLIMGFVRGGLFVASWLGAGLITLKGFLYVQPLARTHIRTGWLADLAAAAGLFIGTLIILHIVSYLISAWVRGSRLNMLDRSLGLLAGLASAGLVMSVIYLFMSDMFPKEDPPVWLEEARTRPLVERGALIVYDLIPAELRGKVGEALAEGRDIATGEAATRRVFEQLSGPPRTEDGDSDGSYGARERKDLDRLIEGSGQ